jgi:HK97 gp10 family phage protein
MSEFTKTMELTGFDELDKKLAALDKKVSKGIVRKATRTAIKKVMVIAKANAKSMVGGNMGNLIAKHTKVQVFKHQRKGSYGLRLGLSPDVPEFAGLRIGSHTRINFERGTGAAATKIFRKIGKSVGRWYIPAALEYGHGNARPIPFMRSAYNKGRERAIRTLRTELKQGIEREAMKA